MTNIEKYIELKEQEKKIKEQIKELQPIVLEEIKDSVEYNWYRATKSMRMTFKLKEEVDLEEIFEEYPEATELKINTKELSQSKWAKKYLDIEEKEYLTVKKI